MTQLAWDQTGEKVYENGVDHGVLYVADSNGDYPLGVAWNGLTTVTESPSGAEANPQYADNLKYVNLYSAEEFGATIEAFTYPDEFAVCDGSAEPETGVFLGQQGRATFGLVYRTKVGTDLNEDAGYKLHLVYGAKASPSEKAYATVNDSPEAMSLSWDVTTTKVAVGTIDSVAYKPVATLTVNSLTADATALAALEDALFGTAGTDPYLPAPATVVGMFAGTTTTVTPTEPTFVQGTNTITIPSVTGVVYKIDGEVVAAGDVVITTDTIVTAYPLPGYAFPAVTDDDWLFTYVAP